MNYEDYFQIKNLEHDLFAFANSGLIIPNAFTSGRQLTTYHVNDATRIMFKSILLNDASMFLSARQLGITWGLCVYVTWAMIFKKFDIIVFHASKHAMITHIRNRIYHLIEQLSKNMIDANTREYIKLNNGSELFFRTSLSQRFHKEETENMLYVFDNFRITSFDEMSLDNFYQFAEQKDIKLIIAQTGLGGNEGFFEYLYNNPKFEADRQRFNWVYGDNAMISDFKNMKLAQFGEEDFRREYDVLPSEISQEEIERCKNDPEYFFRKYLRIK